MDFSVEIYETSTGRCPVHEFLDELKASDPGDFAAVLAGLEKLRHRAYHGEPLSMKKTNFDQYLEDQMQDPAFAARFEQAVKHGMWRCRSQPCANGQGFRKRSSPAG